MHFMLRQGLKFYYDLKSVFVKLKQYLGLKAFILVFLMNVTE